MGQSQSSDAESASYGWGFGVAAIRRNSLSPVNRLGFSEHRFPWWSSPALYPETVHFRHWQPNQTDRVGCGGDSQQAWIDRASYSTTLEYSESSSAAAWQR